MENSTAAERIAFALKEGKKVKGFRGPKGQRQHVELVAKDIIDVCGQASEPDEIVDALLKGSSDGKPERLVTIQADDAFHLIEKAGKLTPPI